MNFLKRVFFFLAINLLVILTISFLLNLFKVQPFLSSYGLDTKALMIFCLIWGMGGAFISLLLSKQMAKWIMKVKVINPDTAHQDERALIDYVRDLAGRIGLPATPQIGIYNSNEVNAFATGPSKKSALIAVSTGLLDRLGNSEVKAVLGHELSHIANGDMVTMTLLQGIANAFVMFLARVFGYILSGIGKDRNSSSSHVSYFLFVSLFEILFMILGSIPLAFFSRQREYRADASSALLVGKESMIDALKALKAVQEIRDPTKEPVALRALKISAPSKRNLLHLFATHPLLDDRIKRLEEWR